MTEETRDVGTTVVSVFSLDGGKVVMSSAVIHVDVSHHLSPCFSASSRLPELAVVVVVYRSEILPNLPHFQICEPVRALSNAGGRAVRSHSTLPLD